MGGIGRIDDGLERAGETGETVDTNVGDVGDVADVADVADVDGVAACLGDGVSGVGTDMTRAR